MLALSVSCAHCKLYSLPLNPLHWHNDLSKPFGWLSHLSCLIMINDHDVSLSKMAMLKKKETINPMIFPWLIIQFPRLGASMLGRPYRVRWCAWPHGKYCGRRRAWFPVVSPFKKADFMVISLRFTRKLRTNSWLEVMSPSKTAWLQGDFMGDFMGRIKAMPLS